MNSIPITRRAALALCATAASTAHTQTAPSAQAFFRDPAFAAAQFSPSGRHVAFLTRQDGQRNRLAVLDLQTMKPAVLAAYAEADIDDFTWVNDQRLVFDNVVELSGPGRAENGAGLFAVDADGQGYRQLVESAPAFVKSGTDRALLSWKNFLLGATRVKDSDDVLVVNPQELSNKQVGYIQLHRVNTRSGRATEIETPLHAVRWLIDAKGQVRVVETNRDNKVTVQVRQDDGAWKIIDEGDAVGGASISPRWIGPDGTIYAVARANGSDTLALHTLDAASGKLGAALLAVKGFDVNPQFIATDDQLLGIRFTADAQVTHWLDARMKVLQAAVDKLLPDTANLIAVPKRSAAPHVLVHAFSDAQPGISYLYDRDSGKLSRLGNEQPQIEPRRMGRTDFVRIKARDGLEIPAYLTMPPGVDAQAVKKSLPMVVLVHGGPWVRGMSWRWDPEVQFLATRGYAVLQPEFRGSKGYGARLFEAGFKQWGQSMQTDVADATRWAIEQGVADPKRVCLMGASYGGYATLMGLPQEPQLYRCGVQWLGVTDIGLMFSAYWSDVSDDAKRYGLPRLIGDPAADKAALDAASPVNNAARIRQPLLMAYGLWDQRVPIEHGQRLRDALAPHNRNVEWLTYANEAHGWRRSDNRIDFWNRVERFLAAQLGR